jgi:disulfide bond formation protein DsbB
MPPCECAGGSVTPISRPGFAVLAFLFARLPDRGHSLVWLAAIAISGAIGVYHAGVELKIFQGFTTCTAMTSAATTDELFRQIAEAPLIRCDQVQWSLLGISMAGWNAIVSLSGAAVIAFLTLKGSRR